MNIYFQGNLDKTKAIKLIFSLEAAINNALNNAKDQQVLVSYIFGGDAEVCVCVCVSSNLTPSRSRLD